MKTNYDEITKDQALDILIARIENKFPGVDSAKERDVLAKQSRASLLHSIGSQWYGDIAQCDEALCAYAYGKMTRSEQQKIDQAG